MIPQVSVPEGSKGAWSVERFTVNPSSIEALRLSMSGRSIRAGEYTALRHKGRGVVMSDTPAEMQDHYGFIRSATGHVLINGLGIGMCLNAALLKPEVTRATVIEIDADVIALVGPHYLKDSRVQIIHSSAFDYPPPKGVRYGAVWHDIWDAICADNLSEMTRLHRKYGRLTEWQGSWCKEQCQRADRETREWRRRWR